MIFFTFTTPSYNKIPANFLYMENSSQIFCPDVLENPLKYWIIIQNPVVTFIGLQGGRWTGIDGIIEL